MGGPWEDFAPVAVPSAAGPWQDYAAATSQPAYSGSVLPFSRDAAGNVRFDSNAGILGTLKRAVTLPGDVAAGRVDPNSDEALGRAVDLAGVASPMGVGARTGAYATLGPFKRPIDAPSADALKEAADAGYKAVRGMGVDYSPKSVSDLASGVRTNLEQDGILGELAPKTFSILQKLETPPDGAVAVPFGNLEAARRAFGLAAKDFNNPTDQLAARRVVEGIDNFTSGPPEAAVLPTVPPATAQAAADTVKAARGNYAAAMRSDKLSGIEDAADLRAAAANSGANGDNAIRSRVAGLLLKPKDAAGYSPEELAALEQVAKGGLLRNSTRAVGNLLGGGGGLGSMVSGGLSGVAGVAAGGPFGAMAGLVPPAVGLLAKKAANSMTRGALNSADELVRQRSPLYQNMRQEMSAQGLLSPEYQDLMRRGLLSMRSQN